MASKKKSFLRQICHKISNTTAAVNLCRCHNLQRQITLEPLWRAAASSLPFPLFLSLCNSGILKVSDPWSPPTRYPGSHSLCPELTFQDDSLRKRIPRRPQLQLMFVIVRVSVRKLCCCSIQARMLALLSARSPWISSHLFGVGSPFPPPVHRPPRWAEGSGFVWPFSWHAGRAPQQFL